MQIQNVSSRIKNIIFDFGGVILNIDQSKVKTAFQEQGVKNVDQLIANASQLGILKKFEKGLITPFDFRDSIRKLTAITISDEQLDAAWNQLIGNFPADRIELLKNLGAQYRLFILSNTNSIHYDFFTQKFRRQFGFDLLSLFEETFWSFEIGASKPDSEIFQFVMRKGKLDPLQTLYIDDSVQNCNAAKNLKINAVYLKPGLDMCELFENIVFQSRFLENSKA